MISHGLWRRTAAPCACSADRDNQLFAKWLIGGGDHRSLGARTDTGRHAGDRGRLAVLGGHTGAT